MNAYDIYHCGRLVKSIYASNRMEVWEHIKASYPEDYSRVKFVDRGNRDWKRFVAKDKKGLIQWKPIFS